MSDPVATAAPRESESDTEPIISEDEFDFIAAMKVSEAH